MKWLLAIVLATGCGPAREAGAPPDAAAPPSPSLEIPAPPPAPEMDPALSADLATMRAHDQHTWTPAAGPAMAAAQRVFAAVDFKGMTTAEVERLIGPPMTKDADRALWQYYFHDGESGVVRWLHIADNRVVSVEVVPTQ